jgi:hypothetical protein
VERAGRFERPLDSISSWRLCRLGYARDPEDHRRFEPRPQEVRVPRSAVDASGPREMEDPGGFEPLAAGLKGQSLSIRVYARGPETPFAIMGHGGSSFRYLEAALEHALAWCALRDLNADAFRRQLLRLLCLPFHQERNRCRNGGSNAGSRVTEAVPCHWTIAA